MSAITTHVLDTSGGRPAAGVPVQLERGSAGDRWDTVGRAETDADGRVRALVPDGMLLTPGTHRLTFNTRSYFERLKTRTFYPYVIAVFVMVEGEAHYHVALLVSPFGYSTDRGS